MISGWEKTLNLSAMKALLLPEAVRSDTESAAESARSPFERFAVPFMFQPRLTPAQALMAALRALLRIFLGSLLFGVWGAYALLMWTSIHNPFLRIAAMIPMIALFVALLCGLLIATTLVLRPRARSGA
jgi:hypothetical protein